MAGEAVSESVQGRLLVTDCWRFDLPCRKYSVIWATGKVFVWAALLLCFLSNTRGKYSWCLLIHSLTSLAGFTSV